MRTLPYCEKFTQNKKVLLHDHQRCTPHAVAWEGLPLVLTRGTLPPRQDFAQDQ